MLTSPPTHRRELRDFGLFVLLFGALAAETFLLPQARAVRPWVEGESIPILGLIENEDEPLDAIQVLDEGFPDRPPAVAVPFERSSGLDVFFSALKDLESQERTQAVRVLHFGDSTIAADGIPGVVRAQLQERFGDAGIGYVPVRVDTHWVYRPGLQRDATGDWQTWNLTRGGAPQQRYGLAGMLSRSSGIARVEMSMKRPDGTLDAFDSLELHVLHQPGGGALSLRTPTGLRQTISTSSEVMRDEWVVVDLPSNTKKLHLHTAGDGPVTVFGVSLEKSGPGVVWDTLGVAGSSIGSMARQDEQHLKASVAAREPSLIIYQTGGNALGYDSFRVGDGRAYKKRYLEIFKRMRAGAPDASCLIVGPLDQGKRKRGQVFSHPEIPRMIALQRAAAVESDCAFWDARAVMGGEGGYPRWMKHEPSLTWTDLMHLSQEGSELVGQRLMDAIRVAYAEWEHSKMAVQSKVQP